MRPEGLILKKGRCLKAGGVEIKKGEVSQRVGGVEIKKGEVSQRAGGVDLKIKRRSRQISLKNFICFIIFWFNTKFF